jgi:hypothetical protein
LDSRASEYDSFTTPTFSGGFLTSSRSRERAKNRTLQLQNQTLASMSSALPSAVENGEVPLVTIGQHLDLSGNHAVAGFVRLLARCVYALSGGVRRAHLLAPLKGALLKELYTRYAMRRSRYRRLLPYRSICANLHHVSLRLMFTIRMRRYFSLLYCTGTGRVCWYRETCTTGSTRLSPQMCGLSKRLSAR